jgi:hypothetical protein
MKSPYSGQEVTTGCAAFVNRYGCCSSTLPFVRNCGTNQTGTSGTIQTPNYPSTYGNGAACVWNINAPTGYYINLTTTNFQTEANDRLFILLPQTCNFAANTYYYSGSFPPPGTISIAQNTVSLYFYSDASTAQAGFSINWTAYTPGPGTPACLSTLDYGTVKNCGSDQTGTSGSIQSPNYPINYGDKVMCSWNINAPAGTVITLNFTYFYTDQGGDYFHVLLPQDCSPVVKRFGGRLSPQVITVPQNTAALFFRSDSQISYTGFTMNWYATPTCSSFVRNNLPTTTQAGRDDF